MTNYSQLNQEQRYQIHALLKAGHNQAQISRIIQVHKSTISRELKRNSLNTGMLYDAEAAHKKTVNRHQIKRKHKRFTNKMKDSIRIGLKQEKLSPELISVLGRSRGEFVSHETIYKWIWNCKKSQKKADKSDKYLFHHLRHGKRRQKRSAYKQNRGLITNRISIDQRPAIVSKRTRIGDFEVDLMMGKNYQPGLLVALDRATLQTRLVRIYNKNSTEIARKLIQLLSPYKQWIKTITFDNDLAFAAHHLVAQEMKVKTYFTRPYTSQDKGSVENRIGVVRRFIPKKTDMKKITQAVVMQIQQKLNNRPVRKFNYKTPNQVLSRKLNVALIG